MIERKKAYIGTGIGKKKCDTCVIDEKGRVLERGQYCNTTARAAASYAKGIAAKYDVHSAACKTTGNMWTRTFRAFEDAKINIKLANTCKMAVIIAKTGKKKTDKVDAQKIAQVFRMNMIQGLRAVLSHQGTPRNDQTEDQDGAGPHARCLVA